MKYYTMIYLLFFIDLASFRATEDDGNTVKYVETQTSTYLRAGCFGTDIMPKCTKP